MKPESENFGSITEKCQNCWEIPIPTLELFHAIFFNISLLVLDRNTDTHFIFFHILLI